MKITMFLALLILGVTSALKGFDEIISGDEFGPLELSWLVCRFEVNSNFLDSATKFYFISV